MQIRTFKPVLGLVALMVVALVGGPISRAAAQAPGSDYPYQGRAGYTLDATINQVDTDRDRLAVTGDDGRAYTVDTYQTAITLRDTKHPGQIGDLIPGMRLHIVGTRAASDLIEADRVSVLPYRSDQPIGPVSHTAPVPGNTEANAPIQAGERVTLRGTVDSVDNRRRAFVLHINDHTRRVFIDDTTDLRDLSNANDDPVPLHTGDRVSVVGNYGDDGSVLASLVTPRRLNAVAPTSVPTRLIPPVASPPFRGAHALQGRISQESSYFSRDIKVRLNADEEVTVHVPKNIPIRRDGRAISVHDLHKDDVVRVTGSYNGDAYLATAIDLVSANNDGD